MQDFFKCNDFINKVILMDQYYILKNKVLLNTKKHFVVVGLF